PAQPEDGAARRKADVARRALGVLPARVRALRALRRERPHLHAAVRVEAPVPCPVLRPALRTRRATSAGTRCGSGTPALDAAVVAAIGGLLPADVLDDATARALARLRERHAGAAERRAALEGERGRSGRGSIGSSADLRGRRRPEREQPVVSRPQ